MQRCDEGCTSSCINSTRKPPKEWGTCFFLCETQHWPGNRQNGKDGFGAGTGTVTCVGAAHADIRARTVAVSGGGGGRGGWRRDKEQGMGLGYRSWSLPHTNEHSVFAQGLESALSHHFAVPIRIHVEHPQEPLAERISHSLHLWIQRSSGMGTMACLDSRHGPSRHAQFHMAQRRASLDCEKTRSWCPPCQMTNRCQYCAGMCWDV